MNGAREANATAAEADAPRSADSARAADAEFTNAERVDFSDAPRLVGAGPCPCCLRGE